MTRFVVADFPSLEICLKRFRTDSQANVREMRLKAHFIPRAELRRIKGRRARRKIRRTA